MSLWSQGSELRGRGIAKLELEAGVWRGPHSSARHTRRHLDDSLSRAMKMGGAGEPRPPARPGPRPSLLYRRLREVEQGAGAASPGQGADTWGGGGGGNTGPSSHGANLRRRRGSVGGRTPGPGPGWGGSSEVEEGPPMVRGARVRYTSSSRRMLAAASSGSAAAGAGELADMGAAVGVVRAVTAGGHWCCMLITGLASQD